MPSVCSAIAWAARWRSWSRCARRRLPLRSHRVSAGDRRDAHDRRHPTACGNSKSATRFERPPAAWRRARWVVEAWTGSGCIQRSPAGASVPGCRRCAVPCWRSMATATSRSTAFPARIAGGVRGPRQLAILEGCGHVAHRTTRRRGAGPGRVVRRKRHGRFSMTYILSQARSASTDSGARRLQRVGDQALARRAGVPLPPARGDFGAYGQFSAHVEPCKAVSPRRAQGCLRSGAPALPIRGERLAPRR